MKLTTVMGVIIIAWSGADARPPPRAAARAAAAPGLHPAAASTRRREAVQPAGWRTSRSSSARRHPGRLRPLAAGHERRGIAGPGQPRDRGAQAQEPAAGRLRDLPLLDAADEPHQLPGRSHHPRRQARARRRSSSTATKPKSTASTTAKVDYLRKGAGPTARSNCRLPAGPTTPREHADRPPAIRSVIVVRAGAARRARRRRLPRQPHQRPGAIPRRPGVAQDRHGMLRRASSAS